MESGVIYHRKGENGKMAAFRRKIKQRRKTLRQWLVMIENGAKMDADIKTFTRPDEVAGKEPPEDLSGMTMGQVLTMSGCESGGEMFFVVCKELLGMKEDEVLKADAAEVVRFVGWTIAEIDKINKRFQSIKVSRTQEEIRAGIDKMDNGAFGIVDWYARRMGISDHEEVMSVPWLRVYQCLKMDAERGEYEKRLSKIMGDMNK